MTQRVFYGAIVMEKSTKYYRDVRAHLQALEERGQLHRIKRAINKDTELMPLVRWQFRGLEERDRKAFLFENVVDAKGKSPGLNPSAYPPGQPSNESRMGSISALLIDATRPWPYPPVSLPRKEFMEKSKVLWEDLGLPALKPRMPWFGYSLGDWTTEDEREAELAIAGDHFMTGERQKGQRVKP
jgi:hypothetical protein